MTTTPDASPPACPDELDAVIAAPAHHTVLLENDHVRVLDTRIAPGDTVPLHTHRWPSVLHVLSWSDIVRRDEHGAVVLDSRTSVVRPPEIMWSPPLSPHTLENVGTTEIRVMSIELKGAAG
jgi:mannose-6-phosphate isomerase-like protein (cupin superfamily)